MEKALAFKFLRHCGVPEVLHYWVMFNFLRDCRLDPQSHSSRVEKASAFPPQKKAAFTLAEGASHGAMSDSHRKIAFTLAEVLITLGIIGVVAALTLPALLANIQGKVRAEQIRTVKYKFTKATDKMKSLSLIGAYPTTNDFVQELRKHLVIAKVCDANHIRECWPYDTVILQDDKEYDISKTKTGKAFKMPKDDNHDYTSPTVGIVTDDGTAMILSFNSKCNALDPVMSYGHARNGSNLQAVCLGD